jgi:hypothetical protein
VRGLESFHAVFEARANPQTGSLLILHDCPFPELEHWARQSKLFDLKPLPLMKHRPSQTLREQVHIWDQAVRRASHGEWDLAGVALMGMVSLGVYQMMKGRFLPPAWSLLRDVMVLTLK